MKLLWLVAAAGGAGLAAGLAPPGALFLGIDLSTQSCTAVVVDARLAVVHRHSVTFDERFPEYGTESGYHAGEEGTATSPVAMWLGLVLFMQPLFFVSFAVARSIKPMIL